MSLDSQMRKRYSEWRQRILDAGTKYHDERKPFVDTHRANRQEFYGALKQFLGESMVHLEDFAEFLSGNEFSNTREGMRGVLVDFAQEEHAAHTERKEGVLGQVSKTLNEKYAAGKDPQVLKKLIEANVVISVDMKKGVSEMGDGNVLVSAESELGQWILFGMAVAARMDEEAGRKLEDSITLDDMVRYMPSVDVWPQRFREEYGKYVGKKIGEAVTRIGTALSQFRKIESHDEIGVSNEVLDTLEQGGEPAQQSLGTRGSVVNSDAIAATVAQEQLEQGLAECGIVRKVISDKNVSYEIEALTPSTLEAYIAKKADNFAPSDKRMVHDIGKMIEILRGNPRGPGTKNMAAKTIRINHKLYPFRSFAIHRSGKQGEMQNLKSDGIRIIYVLHEDKDKKVVGIIDILEHDEYTRRTTSSSGLKII